MFPLAELFKLLGYETQVSDNKGNAEVAVHYDNSIYIATAGSKSSSVYDSTGTTLYRTVNM